MKYEYKVIREVWHSVDLSLLGKEGWLLVAVSHDAMYVITYYFARPL